ncbi:uncharacterized protein Dwil_GK27202 [Drosophila willistoni]|uniref:FAD synthase n=1 Tax=Drosophila willistoni TaxID=7260 RepID=A0A0Q9WZ46_DROWI|nr:FAD synthase [Drosophila willistoni]KRF98862.1 uncharacterized protein Dwil_GK27202 [Drosophila willistoni]
MHKCYSHTPPSTITSTAPLQFQPGTHKCVLALSSSSSSISNMSTASNNDCNNASCCDQKKSSIPGYTIPNDTRSDIKKRQLAAYHFFSRTLELYRVDELIFCFNGGKDCTVLLDLLMRWCRLQNISSRDIPMLYIKSDDAFEEIDEFVAQCVERYDVQLIEYKESLKEALTHMTQDMPRIKAVFIGSRNTDPYCEHLAPMQPTDNGWPAIMRLNPLLEWSYHDIWHYIHINNVPFCCLYDQGYTSIGYKSNTVPNPHLKCSGEESTNGKSSATNGTATNGTGNAGSYRPAWELIDPTQERAGRLPKK